MKMRDLFGTLMAATVAVALAGCDARANPPNASPSPGDVGDRAGDAASQAGEAIEGAARKAGDALERAAEKAEPAAEDAARRADAARRTVEIKAALMADASIDSSDIDVDTDADTRTVTLKGAVATAAQKAAAERIATGKADGFTVKNLLVVASR